MVRLILTFIVNFFILASFWMLVQFVHPLNWPFLQDTFRSLAVPYDVLHITVVLSAAILLVSCALTRTAIMQMFVCWLTGCKRPVGEEADKLEYVMAHVCQCSGIPRQDFKLYVSNMKAYNAFAVGNNHIAVTRPLLYQLAVRPLCGILAHEMGHLVHGDSRVGYMCYVMSWFGNFVIRLYQWIITVLNFLSFIPFAGIFLVPITWFFLLQTYVFYFLLNLPLWFTNQFLSRRDEYAADRYACEIGLGRELYEGLSLLSAGERKQSFWQGFASDHPGTHKRLERIERYLYGNE